MPRNSPRPLSAMLRAMLWELWRVSRWELLFRFSFAAAFVLLIFFLSKDFDGPEVTVIRGILLVLLGIVCVFSTTWTSDLDNQASGFAFRLGFTRPVSNLQLVLTPMAYSAATAIAGYLICALLVRALLGESLPLLGPLGIIGCVVCLFAGAAWSSTCAAEKILGVFVAAMAILGALWARHRSLPGASPILMAVGEPGYFDLTWREHACLLLASGVALAATVWSVGRQRYGEGLSWSLLPTRLAQAMIRNRWLSACRERFEAGMRLRGIRGPLVAQIWFETRRSVHVAFVAIVCSGVALAFVVIAPLADDSWVESSSPPFLLAAIVFSPLVYQLIATDPVVGLRHRQGATQLSLFDAVRPLRCDQLIAIKLLVVAGWSVFGFLLMALTASAHATLAGQWRFWREMHNAILEALQRIAAGEWDLPGKLGEPSSDPIALSWWLAGACQLILVYFCSTAMLMTVVFWISRCHKTCIAFASLTLLHLGIWAWDVSLGGPFAPLWRAYGWLIPIALVLLSLYALKSAISGGYVGRAYLAGTLCLWMLSVASSAAMAARLLSIAGPVSAPPLAWLWGVALLVAPLGAAACAPLALAAYRHG